MIYPSIHADSGHHSQYQTTPRFIEWELEATVVTVPKLMLKQAGWKKIKYPVLRISAKSYVDTETGEIIKKRDMFKLRYPVPQNTGLKLIEQLRVINSLSKKAKELCLFLLKMRNNRGSFVLPLSALLNGYINRNGAITRMCRARAQHGKLITEIAQAGVIANEQALGTLFQRHGHNTPQAVLEEAAIWYGWPGIFQGKALWAN
ncbi:hypothetical protein AWB79_07539 [Caballeronia hypogeia]|uniref:Uncharacterized protein n=1 Tax=Caballeronia hypogeia TaxID=1777140 RepID=A0A158DTF3_9BURK|nr:hypothetical protein [Caballeronia hypogeia]SAK97929.1 hypothetical protein AWB79_07539 [Caballeronia hypogeia]